MIYERDLQADKKEIKKVIARWGKIELIEEIAIHAIDRTIAAEKERDELQQRVEIYADSVESLYQIIQRGDLTSFDMTQADEVLERLREDTP